MLIDSKGNIRPLEIAKQSHTEVQLLRRTLSFGEEVSYDYESCTRTIISRSSIVSLGVDNLVSFEPLEKSFQDAQPAIYKGGKVFILIDSHFVWWFLKSDTQFFPLDFIPLDSLDQVIF